METLEIALVTNYEKWNEERWYRTWLPSYNDGGWVIGTYTTYFVVWLDRKNDKPVLVSEEEMAW